MLYTTRSCFPRLRFISGCPTLTRLKLSFLKFPLVDLRVAPFRDSNPNELRYKCSFLYGDIYEEAINGLEASRVTLDELRTRFIPLRATPAATAIAQRSQTASTSTSTCPVGLLTQSLSSEARLEDSSSPHGPPAPLIGNDWEEIGGAAATANASEMAKLGSETSKHKQIRKDQIEEEQKQQPTLVQRYSEYDSTVQHMDSLLMRIFDFPALEQLELSGQVPGAPFVTRQSFLVRLVRHLTRFRETDAPDSPTRLRRVDLSDTGLFEHNSSVRLMRLLAPHVEFIVSPSNETHDESAGYERIPELWYGYNYEEELLSEPPIYN